MLSRFLARVPARVGHLVALRSRGRADRGPRPGGSGQREAVRRRRVVRKPGGPLLLRGRPHLSAKQDHHRHRQGPEKRPRTRGVLLGLLSDQAETDRARQRHGAVRGLEPRRQRDARLLQPRDGQPQSDVGRTDGRRIPDESRALRSSGSAGSSISPEREGLVCVYPPIATESANRSWASFAAR